MSAETTMDWNARVLQDLVYERVRFHVDLLALVDFERELGDSIDRALEGVDGAQSDGERVSRGLLEEAWRRLEAEWRRVRDAECPLCTTYDSPASVS
jgi:hypothetical protein